MSFTPAEEKLIAQWMYGAPHERASIVVDRPTLATIISLMGLGLLRRVELGMPDNHVGLGILHTLISTIGVDYPQVAAALRRGLPAAPTADLTSSPQPRSFHGRQNLN